MKKMSQNRIVSLCISGIISFFLAEEIIMLITAFGLCKSNISLRIVHCCVWIMCICLFYIMQRKIYKSQKNRLIKYFFFAIVIALSTVVIFIYVSSKIFTIPSLQQYIQTRINSENSIFLYLGSNIYIFGLIAVFVIVFSIVIKSKIKYIQYISKSVKEMEKNGFGQVVEVRNEDELSELSRSINCMSKSLYEKQEAEKRQEESKNKIIADISHDLRTPLTSVVGYINLLKEEGFENKELCSQYIEVIDRRIHNMNEMINQLFEYTKLIQTDTPLHLNKVNFISVLSYIDYEYKHIFKKNSKSWRLVLPEHDLFLNIDEEKIIRAIGNLLDNANKYSTSNSEITMEVIENNQYVVIEISNMTELLKEEDVANIFERFYRADSSRTKNEQNSTGLGLPIVKRIIELHGGLINVKFNDKKITFSISMPYINY